MTAEEMTSKIIAKTRGFVSLLARVNNLKISFMPPLLVVSLGDRRADKSILEAC